MNRYRKPHITKVDYIWRGDKAVPIYKCTRPVLVNGQPFGAGPFGLGTSPKGAYEMWKCHYPHEFPKEE